MSGPLPVLAPEAVQAKQELIYRDPSQWSESTPVSASARLRSVLRYMTIAERYGVMRLGPGFQGGLRILEPGCGVGSLSSVLALFGEVLSFDLSSEAIRAARGMFGHLPQVMFFQADGTKPDCIPELKGRTFDLILIREFIPLARHLAGKPPPQEIVRGYYERLSPGGVLIIEYALRPGWWRRSEPVLQVGRIAKEFHGRWVHAMALDVAHLLVPGLRGRFDGVVRLSAGLLSPLASLSCVLRRINSQRTLVLTRRS